MKPILKISILFLVIAALFSCSKNDNNTTTLTGSWKVSSLVVDGNDMTSECEPYTIMFNEDGSMDVMDSTNQCSCEWQEHSGMMNSSMMNYQFNMMGCPDDSPMNYIDGDWELTHSTSDMMQFEDANGANSHLYLARI